jgi:methyl-accepting chemotaxis protein
MKTWKVAHRMYLLVGIATVVMLGLAGMNWLSMSRLAALQDASHQLAKQAGQMERFSGLGADTYRVIADTALNRQFDDAARRWRALTGEVDGALASAVAMATTDQDRQALQRAVKTMQRIRQLYTEQYLPLAQSGAPLAALSPVDDAIDKLVSEFDGEMSQVAIDLVAQADEADEAFDQIVLHTRLVNTVAVMVGGAILAVLALGITRSLTAQLGLEPAEAMAVAQRIADGDLSGPRPPRTPGRHDLAGALATMVDSLERIVRDVRGNADNLASASLQIAQGNQDLSVRTEEQAAALQQTAATMQQLGAVVRDNADSATQANTLAQGASDVAARGGQAVRQVVHTMADITESSRRISDIITVIDGIAFQTNILALNAAVEAARAGEQGRGFAVVASEVRSLAGRSSDAAREIKQLINASVERVEAGAAQVHGAGATMDEIVQAIAQVNAIVEAISAGSATQSQGVLEMGRTLSEMDRNTQQNTALVEESAAAAEGLGHQAQALVAMVARFQVGRQVIDAEPARLASA